ncbi:hypothetical protein ACLOJK_021446 [Asimina triloba]
MYFFNARSVDECFAGNGQVEKEEERRQPGFSARPVLGSKIGKLGFRPSSMLRIYNFGILLTAVTLSSKGSRLVRDGHAQSKSFQSSVSAEIDSHLFSKSKSTIGDPSMLFNLLPLAFTGSIDGQRVGFIGLGNMGFHMANNLINAGFKVIVHDINPNAVKVFSDKGVPTMETPFEVAESSDVIITMLPSSSHVLDVYTGANGLLRGENFLRPWLFIDSSTVDPHTSRRLYENVSKCVLKEKTGFTDIPFMLDAPVSGGVLGAEAGTLTFMAAKICNNLAMAVSMIGVSEAFALGQSLGITAKTLTNIFNSSSAHCWSRMCKSKGMAKKNIRVVRRDPVMRANNENCPRRQECTDTYNPVPGVMSGAPSSRNYDGGFSSKLMAKDLELAVASAQEVGFRCPLTSQARDIYTKLCEEGHEMKDFSGVFRHYYKGKDEV